MRGQKILNWMVAKIAQIHSALIFLMTQILICYYHSHVFGCATFSKDLLAVFML
jgi:hypothetical protein